MKKEEAFEMRISKWLFGVCLMALVVWGGYVGVSAAETEIDGSVFKYINLGGAIRITGYNGTDETVVIPSEIDGKNVTSISGEVCYKCETIKHLIVQEGITDILGWGTFCDCENLETVSLPSTLKTIGRSAFEGCSKLNSVDLPEGVTSIGTSAFFECVGLGSVSIPEGVTDIGSNVFSGCSGLTSVTILGSVTSIGSNAFSDCSGLTSVSIPESVTSIGAEAFRDCSGLTSLSIPESVTGIGEWAFSGCSGLTDISIPEGVTSVESRTFSGCSKLNHVELPNGLTSIGDYAFFECPKLNNVNLPEGLVNIGDYAFCHCRSMEKLIIPDSVTRIGEYAFGLGYDDRIPIYGNINAYIKTYCDTIDRKIKFSCINHAHIVKDAEVAATCQKDGTTSGSRCTDCGMILSGYKTIPASHAWTRVITKEATVGNKGTYEWKCTRCGSYKRGGMISKLAAPKKGALIYDSKHDSYKVTKSGEVTGTVEFSSSKSPNGSIVIPSAVKISGVTYKVTSISKNAFKNNKNLKKITIKGDITKINANAFSGCKNLKTIVIKSKKIKSVGKNAFKGINPKAKIKVPSSKLSKYEKLLKGKGQKSTVKITK